MYGPEIPARICYNLFAAMTGSKKQDDTDEMNEEEMAHIIKERYPAINTYYICEFILRSFQQAQ